VIEPYFSKDGVTLYLGPCEEVMTSLDADSFHAVVTDPPYELGFMGKAWDKTGIAYSVPMWGAVLRTLRPGGHLLSFGGARTYHRMACAIEDAGFEVRNMVSWWYGSGFPKSLDASKAIDAYLGKEREVISECTQTFGINKRRRELGHRPNDVAPGARTRAGSDEAQLWEGWKSDLKPAHEPICLARKPLSEKNIATNVLRWETGCINVDGCRIVGDVWDRPTAHKDKLTGGNFTAGLEHETVDWEPQSGHPLGRYPSNLIIDEEVAEMLDAQHPETVSSGGKSGHDAAYQGGFRESHYGDVKPGFGDKGGPSRFFYVPKASKAERNAGLDHLRAQQKVFNGQSAESSDDMKDVEARFTTQPAPNNHPTVKPIMLMRYLCRMVTPPNGILADPFCGSGSTLVAAILEGFQCVGIDRDEHSLEIAAGRIEHAILQGPKMDSQGELALE
jgi:DNA modification methylase